MAGELRFIDPAFCCEVILRGDLKCLYDKCSIEFKRLKDIRNLGLIGYFNETGFHTKHHHLIGLHRCFQKCLKHEEKGIGLPSSYIWSFWPRICFAQAAHATLTYNTERSILLAAKIKPEFRDDLKKYFSPVFKYINDKFSKKEIKEDSGNIIVSNEIDQWFNNLIEKFQWRQLYLWNAALMLINHKKILETLDDKRNIHNEKAFDELRCFNILLNPIHQNNLECKRINSLDYVIRDLCFIGRAGINLDVDRLLEKVNDPNDQDWTLVEEIEKYLTRNVYTHPKHQLESKLFQRALAYNLISNKFSIENVFGLDSMTDDKLISELKKVKKAKTLFDKRKYWQSWVLRTSTHIEEKDIIDTEYLLAGRWQGLEILNDHYKKNFIAFPDINGKNIIISMFYEDPKGAPDPASFILFCQKILSNFGVHFDDYAAVISEGILGKKVECNMDEIIEHLVGCIPDDTSNFFKASKYICRHNRKGKDKNEPNIVIDSISMPISNYVQMLPLKIMQNIFMDPDNTQKNLGMDIKFALRTFWNQVICSHKYKSIENFIPVFEEVKKILVKRIISNNDTSAKDAEILAFLESLVGPAGKFKFHLTLPNLKVMKPEVDEPQNEHDVVSFFIDDKNNLIIWAWECTVNNGKSAKKRKDDWHKIVECIRKKMSKRWGPGIKVVANSIFLANGEVCTDKDSSQAWQA
ncbi:MAG: hypothetical protein GY750_13240 [Lentisphaerae bacterium]|nr:hypothetical protein [Lentisphaerota bacterium]MCP4102372.1 hypothetical protein [Lentisphaerota bacterium]